MPSDKDKRKDEKERTSQDDKLKRKSAADNQESDKKPGGSPKKRSSEESPKKEAATKNAGNSPRKVAGAASSKSDLNDTPRRSSAKVVAKSPGTSPGANEKKGASEFAVKGATETVEEGQVRRTTKPLRKSDRNAGERDPNDLAHPNGDEPTNPLEIEVVRKGPICWFLMMIVILGAIYLMYQAGPGSLKPDEDEEEEMRSPVTEPGNVSYFPKAAKLNPERSFQHTVKRVPGDDIWMFSPLDVRDDESIEFACNHQMSVISDNLVEIQASLVQGLDHIRREDVRLHFKMEANVSFSKDILHNGSRVNIAVMFSALPKNLTFSYDFVDCSNRPQLIRVIHNPLARRILNEFRQDLVANPDQGDVVDRFRCAATVSPQLADPMELITFRILADINFAKKEFALYTCATGTRVCTEAYRSLLAIDVKKIDVKKLRTYFLVARRDDGKKMNWGQQSLVSTSTWCELDRHE